MKDKQESVNTACAVHLIELNLAKHAVNQQIPIILLLEKDQILEFLSLAMSLRRLHLIFILSHCSTESQSQNLLIETATKRFNHHWGFITKVKLFTYKPANFILLLLVQSL